jgi:maleate isomerase
LYASVSGSVWQTWDSSAEHDSDPGSSEVKTVHRVALLVPASDTVMEVDLWRNLPPDLNLHVARMYMDSTTVEGQEKMLREELAPAARRAGAVRPELAIFGATSASALHGLEGDQIVSEQVSRWTGCPCITVLQSVLSEIRSLHVRRLLLVTPYVEALNTKLIATLCSAGLPVISATGLGLDNDPAISAVTPEEIHHLVLDSYSSQAVPPDCVFISCTTFRGFESVSGLERDLGVPVVSSNLCALRSILRYFQLPVVTPRHLEG